MTCKLAALAALLIALTACTTPTATPIATPIATPNPLPTDHAPPTELTASPSVSTPRPTAEPIPPPPPYDFTLPVPERDAVDDDWFEDAVFLGDSRTDGMHKFSGLKTPAYLHYTGLTVFDFSTRAVITYDGDARTAEEALSLMEPAKIYICLGLNELGWRDDNAYYMQYGAVVDRLRSLHPDAQIYLQLLIPVNSGKCKANNQPNYVNNEKIDVYNTLIRQIAAEKEVYCVDLPAVFAQEDGELSRDMTGDGVHMTRAGYALWADYLRTHTVVREEASQ